MSENNSTYDISYNLFNYAYKELSQDAVICWLIKWAYYDGPDYEQLKKCGKKFLEALFAKHNKQVPEGVSNPEIWQQKNRIDVLARMGDYVLLIEDKKSTKDHSNQLKKYYEEVLGGKTKAGEVGEGFIIPIYLKTGNLSLFDRLRIENSTPYKIFNRCDFWKVVEPYQDAHPILDGFRDYLKYVDYKTQSYHEKGWEKKQQESYHEKGREEKQKENCLSWEGFFRKLEDSLVVFDEENCLVGFDNENGNSVEHSWIDAWTIGNTWGWDYVPNQTGGFAAFYWYYKKVKSHEHSVELYLQLEIKLDKPNHSNLCFKVDTRELKRELSQSRKVDTKELKRELSQIRENCHKRICKAAGKVGSSDNKLVCRPGRMGTGKTMTVALWDNNNGQTSWLVFKSDGRPNIQATVENLMKAQSVLNRVA